MQGTSVSEYRKLQGNISAATIRNANLVASTQWRAGLKSTRQRRPQPNAYPAQMANFAAKVSFRFAQAALIAERTLRNDANLVGMVSSTMSVNRRKKKSVKDVRLAKPASNTNLTYRYRAARALSALAVHRP